MSQQEQDGPSGGVGAIRRDDEWVRAVLTQYAPAVGELLRARYPIFNSCDIDDLMIIAVTRLWRVRNRYEQERSSLKTYFFRIADNVARDILKSGWHRARALEVSLNEGLAARVCDGNSDDALADNPAHAQLLKDIRKIIDELPETYRNIILADACAPERVASANMLAQELQIPPKTVRVYRSRAMNAIRATLRKLGYRLP